MLGRWMKDEELMKQVRSKLDERGYHSRVVPARCVRDLREEIEANHARGLLDESFYQERLTNFSFQPPDNLPDAESLIVVAAPQPQVKVVFTWQGKSRPVTIPPTYAEMTDGIVESILSSVLNRGGYHAARASLPKKLLAVRSGLGEYGRNNICYVRGMGSFNRLVAFYTDLPCLEPDWRKPQMMERCRECRACIHSCPTETIMADRFLVRAERCITFHNERANEFPAWMEPSWHNCLVGCLRCQLVCPENAAFVDWVEGDTVFSEKETDLILNSTSPDRFSSETAKKLDQLGMLEYSEILGRNLAVLLNRER